MKNIDKRLSTIGILYFLIGLIFAFVYALYYRWPFFGYFSPNFFSVVFTWPTQTIGFVKDLLYYGFTGKPI